jgi:hypothetical protein
MENNYDLNAPKIDLPNATVVLVLGILSIIGCCCYGIIGIICAIIALVMAKSATTLYVSEPVRYTESSYKNMNAGKICAWVGLILSILYLIFLVILVATIGIAGLSDPNAIYEFFGVQPPM